VCITALNHTCLSEKVNPIIEIVQHILMETLTSLRIQAVWVQAHYTCLSTTTPTPKAGILKTTLSIATLQEPNYSSIVKRVTLTHVFKTLNLN
jgi:hypothetical protein